MATFDSLPLEIHDKIFEEVISSTLPSPDYKQDQQEDRVQLKDVSYLGHSRGRHVKWQKTQTAHPANALLLVNHQVRAEARGAWKRVVRTLACHADVMFVAEAELRPTFLSVYTDASHFDVVHAQFRVVGLPDPGRGFWSVHDNELRMQWMFFDLLCRFLKVGPWLAQPKRVDRHIMVQRLEINVLSPTDSSLLPHEGALESWHLARALRTPNTQSTRISDEEADNLRRTQMRPEWLCDWIAENIQHFTEMGHHAIDCGGGILYERIGEIAVLLDGREKAIFKLGEMLSELPKGNPWGFTGRELRKEWFGKWKERTIKERLEAGLPVVESNE